ncbi:hypothetical protein CDEST_04251 [Colletotrichum destructivum]|uniref:Uncharacterized protein n=1 Tax=Colletotrichum destructivum TaxID=34406 RepID=A0AAX4I773_9PEZI|nr:hypothetical protein CDEST_04251 [Colletotrichum destructivum]
MATLHGDSPPAGPVSIIEFLTKLTSEPSGAIVSHLLNSHLKNLRPHLRFERVCISANPRNIEVLREIVNHDTFRQYVCEIVWDDSRFIAPLEKESGYISVHAEDFDFEDTPLTVELAEHLHLEVAYSCCQRLVQQQEEALATAAIIAAFGLALDDTKFLTQCIPFFPQYLTPMIRAFPYGFNYPLHRRCPTPSLGARILYDSSDLSSLDKS